MIRLQPVSATKFPFPPPPDLPQFQLLQPPPPQLLQPPHQDAIIVECDGGGGGGIVNNNNNNNNSSNNNNGNKANRLDVRHQHGNPQTIGTPVVLTETQPRHHQLPRRLQSKRGGGGSACTPSRCRRMLFASLICLILSSLCIGGCLTAWGAVYGERGALAGGTILLLCGVGLFFYSCCTTSHYARVYSGVAGGSSSLRHYNSSLSFHGNGCSSCYYSPASPMRLRQQQQLQQLHRQDSGRIRMPQGRNSITDMIQDTVPRCLLQRQSRRHSSLASGIPPVL